MTTFFTPSTSKSPQRKPSSSYKLARFQNQDPAGDPGILISPLAGYLPHDEFGLLADGMLGSDTPDVTGTGSEAVAPCRDLFAARRGFRGPMVGVGALQLSVSGNVLDSVVPYGRFPATSIRLFHGCFMEFVPPEAGFQEAPAPEVWILQNSGIRTPDFRKSNFSQAWIVSFCNPSFRGLRFSKIQASGGSDFHDFDRFAVVCDGPTLLPGSPRTS